MLSPGRDCREEKRPMEILGLNLWEFIFAIVNFVVLVLLLKKFLFKPITKMLDDRKAAIDEALDAADQARLEVASTEEKIREQIAAARAEADGIIADAKKRGEAIRAEIIENAKKDAKEITESASAQIEEEKKQAIVDLKNQIADMVVLATEKVLADGLTSEQENTLMNKYIQEVGRIQ